MAAPQTGHSPSWSAYLPAAAAPVLPVNPPGFALEDRDDLHPEDKSNILDSKVIGMQVCPKIKGKSEQVTGP